MGYCNDSDSESFQGTEFTTPFTRNDILVCATHGKIYAVHKRNGARIWRSDFPKGSTSLFSVGSMGGIVSIFITDQDDLIIASSGKTACLDLYTGAEKWVNKMKVKNNNLAYVYFYYWEYKTGYYERYVK